MNDKIEESVSHEEEVHEEEGQQSPDEEVAEVAEAAQQSPDDEGDDGPIVASFGDDEPGDEPEQPSAAPSWVRDLRRRHRELQKRNRELEAQVAQAPEAAKVLGDKPTLAGHDYDSDEYEKALSAWYERKREVDAEQERIEHEQRNQQQAWQEKLVSYERAKTELPVDDYDDAEESVVSTLNETQQAIIVQIADDAAKLVYALGKHGNKLQDLAKISDPLKFTKELTRLEASMKVERRKPATQPEKVVSGTGPVSGTVDSTLDRLRKDAEKTGDYTKVMQYKRDKRRQA